MVKMYWALNPEELKAFIAKTKSLMIQPPTDFEKYLIDDTLTWHLEAGDIVDPVEVRSAVRRYMSTRQSNKYSADRIEAPPPQQAGGSHATSGSDDDSIYDDVFDDK